jgi:hypothetical protein
MRYERRLVRDFQRCQREHPLWPVVVSEGDSWFSYPFARNLVDWLDDPRDSLAAADQQRWSLLRLERSGDEIMSILAGSQRASLREKLRRHPVETLLFSAGGNDLVGPDLLPLLRPFTAGMSAEECLVEARLERRVRQIRDCYLELVDLCADARPGITIFTHGYDYPLPADRPVWFLGRLAGPWLYPHLLARGIADPALQLGVVRLLIDRFNAVLAGIAAEHPRFVHVDLRGTVGTDPDAWVNEIHPSREGFRRAAKVFLEQVARRHPGVGRVR